MKIGIALGGGGAKGFAHIGVLEVLSKAGINCQIVTGTSAGALVGAAFCSNKLDALKERSKEISLKDIPMLLSPSWSRQGLFSGKNTLELLNDLLSVELIEDLPIIFGATAVDLLTAELIEFHQGNLKSIVRSSISIPGIFTPISWNEKLLVDGSLREVLPVHLARKLGADFVIGVDLYSSTAEAPVLVPPRKVLWPAGIQNAISFLSEKILGTKEPQLNIIRILEMTAFIVQKQLTELRLRDNPVDFMICPSVARVGMLDFHRSEPVVEIGRIAARNALPEIERLLIKSR